MSARHESVWKARKERIDPKLDSAGWILSSGAQGAHRTEEEKTPNGPADYALWLDQKVAAVVEAKKLEIGPQNVLTRRRQARDLEGGAEPHGDVRSPFIYATNGEIIWFRDARHPLNRSRRLYTRRR